jgi:dTDP-3-amino-3,4,6-trideoxy-alpha-D-glucose transaminase
VVAPLRTTHGAEHVHHLYVARSERADELAAALNSAGIGARGYYRTPAHRQEPMSAYAGPELPATDELARTILALPMGPELTSEAAAAVVEACGARAVA